MPKPKQLNNVVFANLKNGTFEITPNGTRLKLFNSNDFLTYQLPFEYDPNAEALLFQQYLDTVLPYKALQNILSEFLGMFYKHQNIKARKGIIVVWKGRKW